MAVKLFLTRKSLKANFCYCFAVSLLSCLHMFCVYGISCVTRKESLSVPYLETGYRMRDLPNKNGSLVI